MAESENRSPHQPPQAHTGYVFMWPEAKSLVLRFWGNCIHHPAKKIQQSRALDTFIEDVISPDSSIVVAAFTERREEKISVHIEQRPAFESMDLALTVVKAIAGQSRIKICKCGSRYKGVQHFMAANTTLSVLLAKIRADFTYHYQ
ncbi:hypothetical protein Tco_0462004 [Tanacetum coccineum]